MNMNAKTIGMILATAVATAVAVVFVLQKQNSKRKLRFDSSEFDDDDFMDDIACPEQCNFAEDGSEISDEPAAEDVISAEDAVVPEEPSAPTADSFTESPDAEA